MPIGQFLAVALVLAWLPLQILSPHITFSNRDVPQQVAEREFPRRVAPVQLVCRNAAGHPHGAFADIPEIAQKRLDGLNLHGDLRCSLPGLNNRRLSASECRALSPDPRLWQILAALLLCDLDRSVKTRQCSSGAHEPS